MSLCGDPRDGAAGEPTGAHKTTCVCHACDPSGDKYRRLHPPKFPVEEAKPVVRTKAKVAALEGEVADLKKAVAELEGRVASALQQARYARNDADRANHNIRAVRGY